MKKPTRVLIVDDDRGMLKTLNYILTEKGYAVVTLDSGLNAMKLIKKEKFDIVLSDLKMPGMNGVQLLKEIKKANPSATVLMITAYTMHEMVDEARKAGANAIFSKPLDLDSIISYIDTAGGVQPAAGHSTKIPSSELLDHKDRELREKDFLIAALQEELAAIKRNPAALFEQERRQKQSADIDTLLNAKQLELFKILSQGEKNYHQILELVRDKGLNINDLAALRLQLSRLGKKLEQKTVYRIERIRRDKMLYFTISSR